MDLCSCRNPCTIVAAMIACLLIAGIPAAMAADGTNTTSSVGGTVFVMSFPEGASIYLNDIYYGITPKRIDNITPGKYVVSISKAGASNDSAPIELFDGSIREIGFTLETASPRAVPAGSGSVAVSSNPGGAAVMLDGNPVGTTRLDGYAFNVNDVPAGSHTITVELAGYPLHTSSVTVIKNQVVKVSADFKTQSTTIPGTPAATTAPQKPAPLPPVTAVAAACVAGLAAVFRRS